MMRLPANTNGLRALSHPPGLTRLHAAPASTGHAPHSTVDAGAALLDTLVLVRPCLRPPAEPYPHDGDTQPATELPLPVSAPNTDYAPLPATEWIPAGVPQGYERMREALDAVGGGSWSVRRFGSAWIATVDGPRGRYDAFGDHAESAVKALLRVLALAGLVEPERDTVRPPGLKSSPRAPRSYKKPLAIPVASEGRHCSRVEPRGPGGGGIGPHYYRRQGARVPSLGTWIIYVAAALGLLMVTAILRSRGLW